MILVIKKQSVDRTRPGFLNLWSLARILLTILVLAGCSSGSEERAEKPLVQENQAARSDSVPLVTLEHWRDSNPNERYAFLIGFVTMLELEKEWQGKVNDGRLLPMNKSLVGPWIDGFANRSLNEIYNGINRHLSQNPGDLNRPVAEVMWFSFVQPRLAPPKTEEPGVNQADLDEQSP